MSTQTARAVERPPAVRALRPRQEIARVLRRRRRMRAGIVQLLAVAIAIALAFLTPHVSIGFEIATNRAIEMLIAVGAGTVTFIGIVFSLLFLVVQFGSTTFTPRLNLFPEVGVPELPLDDRQRDPLVRHLDRVSMPQVVRRESPPDTSPRGEPAKLAAGGCR